MDSSIVFARWRQFALFAHWRHLANAIELVLPSDRQSPQQKRQMDQFSLFVHSSRQSVVGYNWRHLAKAIEIVHNRAAY